MSTEQPSGNSLTPLVVGAGLGIAGTVAWSTWNRQQQRRSRAEREQPEWTAAVLDLLQVVFDTIPLALDGTNEASYRKRIAGYLRKRLELTVEEEPRVDGRMPDMLVEGVVAIEVKLAPRKTEIDRAVGQCVDYAQLWPTLLVVVDTTPSIADEITRRLDQVDCDRVFLLPYTRTGIA